MSNINKLTSDIIKKLGGAGNIISAGGSLAIAAHSYNKNRFEGDNLATAGAKALAVGAFSYITHPATYIGAGIIKNAPSKAISAIERVGQKARSLERTASAAPFTSNTFIDNKQIFTMRQAGVSAMQKSKYDTEHAMKGNEAQYFHK